MAAKKWIQGAIQRPGALKAKAKKAGQTVAEFCSEQHTGRTQRQCNLYKTLNKVRPRRKK